MSADELAPTCLRCQGPILPGQQVEAIALGKVFHKLCLESLHMIKTLSDLPEDVIDEIFNEKYQNRTHGRRATRAKGCNGPLCRKAERDRGFNRMREVRGLEPVLEPPDSKARERDVILDRCLAWYLQWRERAIQAKRLGVVEYNPLYPDGYPGSTRGNRFVKHKIMGE
jgi:hypothetical protein